MIILILMNHMYIMNKIIYHNLHNNFLHKCLILLNIINRYKRRKNKKYRNKYKNKYKNIGLIQKNIC